MKALFVGLGSIGQRHLRNFIAINGDSAEILAFRQRRSVPTLDSYGQVLEGVDVCEHYGIKEFFNLEAAIGEAPEVVFVTNPSAGRIPVALAAANKGCHLFLEKPLSSTWDGVEDLISIVETKNLVAMVGYQYRFHPGVRKVKDWLNSGRIGQVISARFINGEYLPNWHPYEDYRVSYASKKDLGGGALVTQIHDFDIAYWLFGLPEAVFAVGGHVSHLEVDVEDCVSVLLSCRYDGKPLPISITLDYLQTPPVRRFVVVGDQGRITWDYNAGGAYMETRADGIVEECDFKSLDRNQLFLNEMEHFLDAVKNKSEPSISVQESTQSLRVALAARISMESGKSVNL